MKNPEIRKKKKNRKNGIPEKVKDISIFAAKISIKNYYLFLKVDKSAKSVLFM